MSQTLEAKSSKSSYFALCSVFYILGILTFFSDVLRGVGGSIGATIVLLGTGTGLLIWLNGHRIRITETQLCHRNGLYQTRKCDLSEISLVKVETVQFERFRRDLGIPKIVVRFRDKSMSPILINPKPFSLDDLGTFWEIMEANGLCPVRKRVKSTKKGV